MTSILNNPGATIALQNLKSTNTNINKVQSQISSGLKVESAKTNAAIWSVSKIMESDVSGFKSLRDTLSLAESTVSVARQAAESIVERLNTIKEHVVTAQADNVDRTKVDAALKAEVAQIKNTIKTAQFNGKNLLDGTSDATVNFVSSLDRSSTGQVTTSKIGVTSYDLKVDNTLANVNALSAAPPGSTTVAATSNATFSLGGVAETTATFTFDSGYTPALGDTFSFRVGEKLVEYKVTANDMATGNSAKASILAGLKSQIDDLGIAGLTTHVAADATKIDIKMAAGTATTPKTVVTAQVSKSSSTGSLAGLGTMTVANQAGATDALTKIDSMIATAVAAAAALGASEAQISSQSNFLGKLSDSLKQGIGALVEADMEEASARLQALQTQQQLGIQALSIANQAPQALLSLFR